jgi:hypothetical protein
MLIENVTMKDERRAPFLTEVKYLRISDSKTKKAGSSPAFCFFLCE